MSRVTALRRYRLRLERDGECVRLITKGGYNWTSRYPWIVEAALKNRVKRFVIDGEAVVLDVDGVADFNALHSRRHDNEVQLYAFDILAFDGDDLRGLPLSMRNTNLARLRRPDGILSRPSNGAGSAPTCFARPAAWALRSWCRNDATVPIRQGGRSTRVKVKNRKHPAMSRVMESFA